MPAPLKIVGVGGSMASSSCSLAALRGALEGAQAAGAETELLDVRELDLPMYDPEIEDPPASVRRFNETVFAAHGLIWSSPLYHGTISGSFKNALDWLELLADRKYLTDKVVGLVSTAAGTQGLQAVNTMEFVVRALRGWAVPLVLPIPRAMQVFENDGTVKDAKVRDQLHTLGREVARVAGQFAIQPMTTDDAGRIEAEVQRGPLPPSAGP